MDTVIAQILNIACKLLIAKIIIVPSGDINNTITFSKTILIVGHKGKKMNASEIILISAVIIFRDYFQ